MKASSAQTFIYFINLRSLKSTDMRARDLGSVSMSHANSRKHIFIINHGVCGESWPASFFLVVYSNNNFFCWRGWRDRARVVISDQNKLVEGVNRDNLSTNIIPSKKNGFLFVENDTAGRTVDVILCIFMFVNQNKININRTDIWVKNFQSGGYRCSSILLNIFNPRGWLGTVSTFSMLFLIVGSAMMRDSRASRFYRFHNFLSIRTVSLSITRAGDSQPILMSRPEWIIINILN